MSNLVHIYTCAGQSQKKEATHTHTHTHTHTLLSVFGSIGHSVYFSELVLLTWLSNKRRPVHKQLLILFLFFLIINLFPLLAYNSANDWCVKIYHLNYYMELY